jgi:hypothetical protein
MGEVSEGAAEDLASFGEVGSGVMEFVELGDGVLVEVEGALAPEARVAIQAPVFADPVSHFEGVVVRWVGLEGKLVEMVVKR